MYQLLRIIMIKLQKLCIVRTFLTILNYFFLLFSYFPLLFKVQLHLSLFINMFNNFL